MNPKALAELGYHLLAKKEPLNSLHQEIADNFYPERADFTYKRSLGTDFAANLMTSYPITARRSLGDQFTTMLRPTAKPWFHPARKFAPAGEKEKDIEVRQTLEWFEETMRKAMYDPPALFNRSTKLADHDYASFGQCVLSVEVNRDGNRLLFDAWHLKDCAWQENAERQIGFFCRRWRTKAIVAKQTFGDKLNPRILKKCEKSPFDEVELLHMVMDADMYSDDDARGRPRWSIWWDTENQVVIEKRPIWNRHYVVPRWSIVDSQYAYSPAVIAALPDARLIQAMTFTLLEVGEKAANPPIVATKDSIRSDVGLYAGGITWVDKEYDERLGEALRPLSQDFRGFNFGLELAADTRQMIHKAFYLDTLTLPQRAPEMTAYEVGQRIQEYIRNAMPLFEPVESEYNAALCEEVFLIMMHQGAFGSPLDWPRQMRGMEIDFRFESPLHDVIEQQKGQKLMEGRSMVADAIAIEPGAVHVWDSVTALRDALEGVGVPAKWLRSREDAERLMREQQAQEQAGQLLGAIQQSSEAAANIAAAEKDMAAAR